MIGRRGSGSLLVGADDDTGERRFFFQQSEVPAFMPI